MLFKFLYKKSIVFMSLAELMWKSYALDKIRFENLTNKSKPNGQLELFILFIPNKNNNTLTIIDCGIGMTKAGKLICSIQFVI
ncbi:hypothetical protein ACE6H2_006536 [Prunus campanulata]